MDRTEFFLQRTEESRQKTLKKSSAFYGVPAIMRSEPFRIADGLYYVGDRKVCVHLIETAEGLVLIDSGYPGAAHLLVDSIWRAGFDPANVRWILHSHGHMDHFGASEDFRLMYGTKLAIGAAEAESLRKYPKRAMMEWGANPYAPVPAFDRELEDGEIFEFGGVKIRCVLTPGHTPGVMSFFFDVTDNGKTYLAGTFGGAGTNILLTDLTTYNEYPADTPQIMLESIQLLRREPVMIHLGNHPYNSKTFEKRERQQKEGGNPFIDATSWPAFLDEIQQNVEKVVRKNEEMEAEWEKLC